MIDGLSVIMVKPLGEESVVFDTYSGLINYHADL